MQLRPGTYALTLGELDIDTNIVISTAPANSLPYNPALTIIDQTTANSRVIEVEEASTTAPSSLSVLGVTITGGDADHLATANVAAFDEDGGGILMDNAADGLFMQDCVVTANIAGDATTGGNGGGVYTPGVATFIDSTVSGNTANYAAAGTGDGGGIWTGAN